MTESELIEIVFMSITAAEAQFEFWMAVTMALVIAVYTAGESLNLKVRWVIAFLYLSICALFYLRYDAAVSTMLSQAQQLREMGSDFSIEGITLMRVLRTIVVIGATTLAVALIINPRLGGRSSDDT